MKKILFLDRDGVIIKEPAGSLQVDSLEKLEFIPGVITGLHRIVTECDFDRVVMVTNQDGLGTRSFPETRFIPPHEKMIRTLAGEGVIFDEILIDRSFPGENLETRKPGTGMVRKYIEGGYDISNSIVIGDRLTDIELAVRMGSKAVWFSGNGNHSALDDQMKEAVILVSCDWEEISGFLKALPRRIEVARETAETVIRVSLDIDGTGRSKINTGLRFFDHMLEQLTFHSGCDISVIAEGDLDVDEHHTIEDTALALGEAFAKALGGKKGISRYGFLLPMDESICGERIRLVMGYGVPDYWRHWRRA